jgi:hypothetical protein
MDDEGMFAGLSPFKLFGFIYSYLITRDASIRNQQ